MEQLGALPFGQHLPSKFSSHFGKRGRAWAKDLNPFLITSFQEGLVRFLPCPQQTAFVLLLTVPGQSEIDEPGEGRIFQGFPELDLLLIETRQSRDPLPSGYCSDPD